MLLRAFHLKGDNMTFSLLKLPKSKNWYDAPLACPRCGEGNLHHDDVQVFVRDSEDGPHAVTYVTQDGASTSRSPAGDTRNPSARRDGLRIFFTCESCNSPDDGDHAPRRRLPPLAIVQHKGLTYIYWEQ